MPTRPPIFTPQQREVLRLIGEGYTTHEIAAALGLAESTARKYVGRVVELVKSRTAPDGVQGVSLSRREQEVLRLLRLGMTDRQIAETLGIGIRTAEHHTRRVLRKLGKANRRSLLL